jgi:hypothetical protein
MDLLGEKFRVEEGYEVRLPPGDHLILVAGAYLGEAGYSFDRASVVAKRSELFEFKHERSSGQKFWTSRPGISNSRRDSMFPACVAVRRWPSQLESLC